MANFKIIRKLTLEELPKGSLFLDGTTLCLKTEYRTERGAIEAYIVGTGEMYSGGLSGDERSQKEVLQVKIEY